MFRKLGFLALSLVALMMAVPLATLLLQKEFSSDILTRGWVGVAVMGLLAVFFFFAAMRNSRRYAPAPPIVLSILPEEDLPPIILDEKEN